MAQEIILNTTITCPHCGFSKEEIMPVDACVYFYLIYAVFAISLLKIKCPPGAS